MVYFEFIFSADHFAEVDDEYADEDLGDDYDAEKYFDDGEGGSDAEDAGGDGDY